MTSFYTQVTFEAPVTSSTAYVANFRCLMFCVCLIKRDAVRHFSEPMELTPPLRATIVENILCERGW